MSRCERGSAPRPYRSTTWEVGGHAMKTNGTAAWIGMAVFASRPEPARNTGLVRGAENTRDRARRLAGGLRPRPPAAAFRSVPGAPRRTRLRRGKESRHRAAVRRLPLRADAGTGDRARERAGRCHVRRRHAGDADRRRDREDDAGGHLLVRSIPACHAAGPARRQSDRRHLHDDGAHAETAGTAQGVGSVGFAGVASAGP